MNICPSRRRLTSTALLVATGSLSVFGVNAGADASVPSPTVSVTVATPPDGHPSAYPGDPAQWTVAVPGHDATLAARVVTATETDLVATWTSSPLAVGPRQPAVTIAVERSYVQADPSEDGDTLTIQARYKMRPDAKWGEWTTPVFTWLGMGVERGSPVQQGASATYTVPYAGKQSVSQLIVQLRFLVKADRAGELETSMHVTA